jgi:hypothetical protein
MLRFIAALIFTGFVTAASSAQPLTTKPSFTDMLTANCTASHVLIGGAVSPGCGPTPTRAGDLLYFNGTTYVSLAGNNSGTQLLQETSAGVPSWVTVSGTGTVTSITCFGTAVTTSGTCITTGQMPGTATNDNASAGNVGEIITANKAVGSAVTISPTATTVNVTSIPLPGGDWEVHGNICFSNAGTTATLIDGGISVTSATLPVAGTDGGFAIAAPFGAGFTQCIPTGNVRVSLSATTTYFLVALEAYTGTAPAAYGTITARRAR